MFGAMGALLVVALAVPDAFGDLGLTFAIAYGFVRIAHLVLFVLASQDAPDLRYSVTALAVSSLIGITLLTTASFLDGVAQGAMWALAILIDFGGPAIFGVAGWKLVPAHFAERHGLIIILALGESIVVLGVGADVGTSAPVLTAAVLGVALASALWWVYFDVVALVTERRLTRAAEGRERNALARDSYSYLHFPMAAGIVLVAVGSASGSRSCSSRPFRRSAMCRRWLCWPVWWHCCGSWWRTRPRAMAKPEPACAGTRTTVLEKSPVRRVTEAARRPLCRDRAQ
jgi:low temperature requirement protein LtrA